MGMTIDDSIRILEDAQRWRKKYGIFGTEEDDAINKLIEVAKKYQKIEQIVNSNPDYIHHTDMGTYKLNSIREVLEDGNDD